MSDQPLANLYDMQTWAEQIIATRAPDVVIGSDYLRRWWVIPRNPFSNVYLHEFRRSDDDRALHDHPWASTSVILFGQYFEHTPMGCYHRRQGDVASRPAEALHRVELIRNEPAITLFITGPKVREWGFSCPNGWRHWTEFCAPGDSTQVGRGCE